MLRRQRSAPGSAPGSGISLYDRRSCGAASHGSRAQPPCPWHHQGMEAPWHGCGQSHWGAPSPLWVLWPRRRQQKVGELRAEPPVPARGGGSQVALWKRWSGHRCGQSQSWHPAALSWGEAWLWVSAAPHRARVGTQCPPAKPGKAPPLPTAGKTGHGSSWECPGGFFSAPKGHQGHPPCPRGTPVPRAVQGPVQQQC